MRPRFFLFIILLAALPVRLVSQYFPDPGQNLPLPMLYGKDVPSTLGDPDHIMDIFFLIPEDYERKVYFRVYDPGVEGEHDEVRDTISLFKYTVMGGTGCYAVDNHYGGIVLAQKTFGSMGEYDMTHETIGGFDIQQGEYLPGLKGWLFKLVIEGLKGFNGNSFRVEVSGRDDYLVPIEGTIILSDEITFNLNSLPEKVAHLYPFISDKTEKIILSTYDMEKEGTIKIVTPVREIKNLKVSGDDEWLKHEINIKPGEKGKPLDIQIIKPKKSGIPVNIITVRILDQDGLPLMTEPWSVSGYDFVE
jgi:hypothetical protein